MRPTDILKEEHVKIKQVLSALKEEAGRIHQTGNVDIEKIEKFITFSREFTDGSHHTKEERLLFPKMGEKGLSGDSGPIAVMLMEHIEGRRFIGRIEDNLDKIKQGDEFAKDFLSQDILNYCDLLTNHINKEDNILFVMAEKALDDESKEYLTEAFHKVDNEETGEDKYKFLLKIAEEITGRE